MPEQSSRDTFIVRIWRKSVPVQWEGRVEHVRSGASARFQNLDELVTFIARWTPELIREHRRGLK